MMDTHVLLWAADDVGRLSDLTRELLEASDSEAFLSDASVWEMALKVANGKLELPADLLTFVDLECSVNFYQPLAITRDHIDRTIKLPMIHRDPFDRLLVAQAIEEDLLLITSDSTIRRYPVKTLW